jgi:demethylmenaquinone methyltransferase/2-methoxy-6-polyprenyl-1,4-benzoquinol methylase
MSREFPTDREPGSLANAFDSPDAKRRHNRRLFGTIAARYDVITRVLSFGRDQHWKSRLLDLAAVSTGQQSLDLACGTGDLAFAAAERGARVLALDLAPEMIARARAREEARQRDVRWVVGDMTQLPVASATVDVVTTGYGLRNVPDLPAALSEAYRVLKPGGRLCSLDFDRPESAWVRTIYLAYLNAAGGVLGWILHRDPETYQYIPASIRRYPGARGVCALITAAGFDDVRHVSVFGGFMAIHTARRPAR